MAISAREPPHRQDKKDPGSTTPDTEDRSRSPDRNEQQITATTRYAVTAVVNVLFYAFRDRVLIRVNSRPFAGQIP